MSSQVNNEPNTSSGGLSVSADTFDCLVLSGGGAKGSYGAGVAYALFTYYEYKNVNRKLCFIGTSAGALNACVLASLGPEKLKQLWLSEVSNKSILGRKRHSIVPRLIRRLMTRQAPFALYTNRYLEKLIKKNINFENLADKHLILITTNFTRGYLKAFYVSKLMDRFVAIDRGYPPEKQRLRHCEKIVDKDELVSALLSSAAIPMFFPPIKFKGEYYVDGGVGNNTPTREAAYFLRYLVSERIGIPGEVYCVQQDPPAIIDEAREALRFSVMLKRTTEVSQYIHMEPIIDAWNRINYEVQKHEEKVQGFIDWAQATSYPKECVDDVTNEVQNRLGKLGGIAARLNVPMIKIKPSTSLGDTLNFDPSLMKRNIRDGYEDMLTALERNGRITPLERTDLSNRELL